MIPNNNQLLLNPHCQQCFHRYCLRCSWWVFFIPFLIILQLVEKVVSLYTVALNASKLINGDLVSLRYLEETPNKEDGSRFLLEMDIQLYDPEEIAHTSEYVYLKKDSDYLCHTNNFQWTKNAEVYFIVAGNGWSHAYTHTYMVIYILCLSCSNI